MKLVEMDNEFQFYSNRKSHSSLQSKKMESKHVYKALVLFLDL